MTFTETLQMVPQFFYEMEADLEMVVDFVENHLERDMTQTELDELDTYLTTIWYNKHFLHKHTTHNEPNPTDHSITPL